MGERKLKWGILSRKIGTLSRASYYTCFELNNLQLLSLVLQKRVYKLKYYWIIFWINYTIVDKNVEAIVNISQCHYLCLAQMYKVISNTNNALPSSAS